MSSRWLILSINFSYLQSVEMLNETINVKKSREMFLFSALSKHLKTRKMRLLWGIELKEKNNIYSSVTFLRESPKLMANFWGQYVVQVRLQWRFFFLLRFPHRFHLRSSLSRLHFGCRNHHRHFADQRPPWTQLLRVSVRWCLGPVVPSHQGHEQGRRNPGHLVYGDPTASESEFVVYRVSRS